MGGGYGRRTIQDWIQSFLPVTCGSRLHTSCHVVLGYTLVVMQNGQWENGSKILQYKTSTTPTCGCGPSPGSCPEQPLPSFSVPRMTMFLSHVMVFGA